MFIRKYVAVFIAGLDTSLLFFLRKSIRSVQSLVGRVLNSLFPSFPPGHKIFKLLLFILESFLKCCLNGKSYYLMIIIGFLVWNCRTGERKPEADTGSNNYKAYWRVTFCDFPPVKHNLVIFIRQTKSMCGSKLGPFSQNERTLWFFFAIDSIQSVSLCNKSMSKIQHLQANRNDSMCATCRKHILTHNKALPIGAHQMPVILATFFFYSLDITFNKQKNIFLSIMQGIGTNRSWRSKRWNYSLTWHNNNNVYCYHFLVLKITLCGFITFMPLGFNLKNNNAAIGTVLM